MWKYKKDAMTQFITETPQKPVINHFLLPMNKFHFIDTILKLVLSQYPENHQLEAEAFTMGDKTTLCDIYFESNGVY